MSAFCEVDFIVVSIFVAPLAKILAPLNVQEALSPTKVKVLLGLLAKASNIPLSTTFCDVKSTFILDVVEFEISFPIVVASVDFIVVVFPFTVAVCSSCLNWNLSLNVDEDFFITVTVI